jgi:uncharacterized membrane protein
MLTFDPLEHLTKMTDAELIAYTKRQEKKNAKRFNNYCMFFGFVGLIILIALVLGK